MGEGQKNQPDVSSSKAKGILESHSYFLLDDDARALVDRCASELSPEEAEQAKDFPVDLASAIRNRRSLQNALDDGKAFLRTLDPAMFLMQAKAKDGYYNAELDVIEGKLKLLNYLILMSAERAKETRNLSALPKHRDYLKRVIHMLVVLRSARKHAEQGTEPEPLDGPKTTGDSDAPLRYFGMRYLVPAVEKAVLTMTLNRVEHLHAFPASFNDLRLYLVWANALSQNICDVIAKSAQMTLTVTQTFLNKLAYTTGSLGFILYFTKFGISASIVLQNTLDIGLTDKVRKLDLSWQERFKTQWDERKFILLNTAAWGTVNLVCFFWLLGKNMFGFWGNLLSGALLVADLFLVYWQFDEAKTHQNARVASYNDSIEKLNARIEELKKQDSPDVASHIARLELECKALGTAKAKVERRWLYKEKKYNLKLMYGAGMILGFTLLCSFFFPPAMLVPLAGLILSLVGAAICFGLGVTYKALSGEILVEKETHFLDTSVKEYDASLTVFKEVSTKLKESPGDHALQTKSKLLYLSLKKAVATQNYQKQAVNYQKTQIICNILTELILPSIFVLAFVFMPLGIGMPLFAIGLVALFFVNWQVAEMAPKAQKPEFFAALDNFGSWLFFGKSPEPKGLEQFDEQAYQTFLTEVKAGKDPVVILIEQLKSEVALDLPRDDLCQGDVN